MPPTESAEGGQLSESGRLAAVQSSLPLLGTYFSGGSFELQAKEALTRGEPADELTLLLSALRVRVALAAVSTLTEILAVVRRRPNFRYQTERVESVGLIPGRLDATAFALQSGRVTAPPRYPIIQVRRVTVTPENLLAAAAGVWLVRELRLGRSIPAMPLNGPEKQEVKAAEHILRRELRSTQLSDCLLPAQDVVRQGRMPSLLAQVRRRLRAGHVGNVHAYVALADWIEKGLSGHPIADPGDVAWAFYGDAFDSKLFELWCLRAVAKAIDLSLAAKSPLPDLTRRAQAPMYEWALPTGYASLHFQANLGSLVPGQALLWSNQATGRSLGGIPDLVLKLEPVGSPATPWILDPKLRQRRGLPSEELYKVLGYFNNLGSHDAGHGGILYYSTGPLACQTFESAADGRLLAISLDPAREAESIANLRTVQDAFRAEMRLC